MTFQIFTDALAMAPARLSRSALSFEFEALWRNLPRDGLVPDRGSFRPERAARFLRHLLLCDVVLGEQPSVHMRLVGGEFEALLGRSPRGEDSLQFLPKTRHAGAIASVREVVHRPCGLWQVMPVHFERGYAREVEVTMFPLRPGKDGKHLLLILTQFLDGVLQARGSGDKIMSADTALTYRYIDIGAGVPL